MMKALRFYGKEDVRIDQLPEPEVGPGQVKLRNRFTGICGSDLHIYFNPDASGLDFHSPHPITGAQPPQVLGHEFCGTVVETGAGVEGVAIGDAVAVRASYSCGTCPACQRGYPNTCQFLTFHGIQSDGGGLAEFTVVPADMLHVLPDDLAPHMGALVEPMAVAWHAVELSGLEAGQHALVVGGGPIGIGVFFALRARGVHVIVSEPSEARRSILTAIGVDVAVDPTTEDLRAVVLERTSSMGVDAAFDTAGVPAAFGDALDLVVARGVLVVVALHERSFDWHPGSVVMGEKTVVGSSAYTDADFDAVIAAMAEGQIVSTGWVDTAPLDAFAPVVHDLRAGRRVKTLIELS